MLRLSTILFAVCLLTLMSGIHTGSLAARSQPREIYHRAWALVRDNYFDPKFSGVDWSSLEHKFDDRIKTNADAEKYTKEMLCTLKDPSNHFLNAKSLQDDRSRESARIVGIGINLQSIKNDLVVTRTIEAGPAELAGVKAGDVIVAINAESSIGFTPEQAAQRIRGEVGAPPVSLSVKRSGTESVFQFKVSRREIVVKSVSTKMLDGDLGYIQIVSLKSNDTARELRQALRKLASAKGLVIDLRDNGGGLLANALDIGDMLLEKGPICTTFGRQVRHTDIATGAPLTHQPIVVLVDQGTCFEAEILAAALKDNGRAALVGEETGGRGMHTELFDLPEKQGLSVSVGKYITPSGSEINKVGVQPDCTVRVPLAGKSMANRSNAVRSGGGRTGNETTSTPTATSSPTTTATPQADVQLVTAIQYLKERLSKLPSSPN